MKKQLLLTLLFLSVTSLVGHGQLDPSFGQAGIALVDYDQQDDTNQAVVIQNDGKIVTFGSLGGPTNNIFAVARYNSNGTPDAFFHSTGSPYRGVVTVKFNSEWASYGGSALAGAIQKDGKIVAVGTAGTETSGALVIARLLPNGDLDHTFNQNGVGSQPGTRVVFLNTSAAAANGVAIQSDGKIVVVGAISAPSYQVILMRLLPNGMPDPTFNSSGLLQSISGEALGVALQKDGKIVVTGETGNGIEEEYFVARYLPNGALDTSFNGTGIVIGDFGLNSPFKISSIVIQPDQKILIGGYATTPIDPTVGFALLRFLPNGKLDASFNGSGSVVTQLYEEAIACYGRHIALQKDGKIVIGGSSSAYDGSLALARYNANGSLDASFGSGSGTPGITFTSISAGQGSAVGYGLAIQPDGKIIVVGTATNGDGRGFSYAALARYLP